MLFMKGKNDASKAVATLVIVFILTSSLYVLANIPITVGSHTYDLKTFSSYEELLKFLRDANLDNMTSYYGYYRDIGFNVRLQATGSMKSTMLEGESAQHFSKTNIQVDGVDEPDIVKTDGTYIYLVSEEKVYILKAYPPEKAQLLSTIAFDNTPNNIFINGNKLVVFATVYSEGKWYSPHAAIYLYDVSNKSDPILIKTVSINGSHVDARMVDSYVYMIASESIYSIYQNGNIRIPTISVDNETAKILPTSIYYIEIPEPTEAMIHIVALDLNSREIEQKSFMIGDSQTIFVSRENIYITHCTYRPWILNSWYQGANGENEFTIIHKISINNGDIEYVAQGKVSGHVLNQFSMDEHNGYFRIATTVGNVWDGSSRNNVYILDDKLNQVGAIENIAPGEKIHSARFMGDKAYLVTFKKVDPFFTLDLSDPYHPKVLGKLKIPGYSDYLHPYDENHIIGIGKETVEALPEEKESRRLDFAWYQGLKIALFDVSDFEHPKEVARVVIGDRGTYSPVLYNHKALLFDREKNLLVIPVTVYEINDAVKEQHGGYTGSTYGEFTFQGVYIYHISPDDGFVFKGRITHRRSNESLGGYYWYWDSDTTIERSLYIGNTLYTISDSMIKMNDLNTLEDINSIELI